MYELLGMLNIYIHILADNAHHANILFVHHKIAKFSQKFDYSAHQNVLMKCEPGMKELEN